MIINHCDALEMTPKTCIFTVGHSDHSLVDFLELLKRHSIEVVVDTRSHPMSRHCPHFNAVSIQPALTRMGIKYVYMGNELGGRPRAADFYDDRGHVLYWKVAESQLFKTGLQRVRNGAAKYRLALMCAEENPAHCHRRLLIGRVMASEGYQLGHIRASGLVEPEIGIGTRGECSEAQLDMFLRKDETESWKSTQSVLPRDPRRSFLVPSKKLR
jgi:uncharacterized protein (DUF488 family)